VAKVTVEELKKLEILLKHWLEHNNEHAETYLKWAERIQGSEIRDTLGFERADELSEIFKQLWTRTKALNDLFEIAIEKLKL